MILSVHTHYPNTRTYVLKLHRDCGPKEGIAGRVENIATARGFQFDSAEDLISGLLRDLSAMQSSEKA